MRLTKSNQFILLIGLLWLVAIIIINPIGEFPINDDWAYAKNVYNLGIENKFVVDDWPAMTLVSQTIYGSIVVKCFGFSFTVLRLSILLLSILSSITLFKIVLKLSKQNHWLSFTAVIGFCFSSIFCAMSFTFMTDIFFVSFLIFAIHGFVNYLESESIKSYCWFCIFCAIAVLNRQHGLVLPLLMLAPFVLKQKLSTKKILLGILPFFIGLFCHLLYGFLLKTFQIPHNMQSLDKLKEVLRTTDFEVFHIHAGDFLLVAGWMILPIVFLSVLKLWRLNLWDYVWLIIIAGICWLMVYKDWQYYPQGNISRFQEIGPRVVKSLAVERDLSNVENVLKIIMKFVSYISICLGIFFAIRNGTKTRNKFLANRSFYFSLFCFCLIYFLFVVVNEAYFDRYALPFALFLFIALVPVVTQSTKAIKFIGLPLVLLIYIVSIFQVKDHMNWQRNRWLAINYLEEQGIKSDQIDGGFEYNGWYKPGPGYTPDDKSWWWVKDDKYVIAIQHLPGFEINKSFVYQRYIPFEMDTIYVLERR